MTDAPPRRALLVRAGAWRCALALDSVVETLRPLPVSPLAGVPGFVAGLALVRGEPTPVVDLDALLGASGGTARRWVRIRHGLRFAALAVSEVVGLVDLDRASLRAESLLDRATEGAADALGALDGELLVALRAGLLVPESAFSALPAEPPAP